MLPHAMQVPPLKPPGGEGGGGEGGGEAVPPAAVPSASARLLQYWDPEAQFLYQVTPDTSQQNGGTPVLHVYVSEHALDIPPPPALGASQLPTMSGIPAWQAAAAEQMRATSISATSERSDAAHFRCVPAAWALARCRQRSAALEAAKRLTCEGGSSVAPLSVGDRRVLVYC